MNPLKEVLNKSIPGLTHGYFNFSSTMERISGKKKRKKDSSINCISSWSVEEYCNKKALFGIISYDKEEFYPHKFSI